MRQVGLFEAKNKLSELVDAASAGEEIVITKRGKPVARLGPAFAAAERAEIEAALRALDERARAGGPFTSAEIRAWVNEGRK
jgi:prevent-host-death family protein